MSMKAVKEKKRKKQAGKAQRAWNRSNDHVRDVMHSVAFLLSLIHI